MNECQPLVLGGVYAAEPLVCMELQSGRGLHSSTSQLNMSRF